MVFDFIFPACFLHISIILILNNVSHDEIPGVRKKNEKYITSAYSYLALYC